MSFAPTDEQLELLHIVRSFLADKAPPARARRLMDTVDGFDAGVWAQLSKELGLPALHIPERHGGMGFSFVELGLVFEELGRALLGAPFFSSIALAANAVLTAGTEEQRATLLPGIAAGQTRATVAVAERGSVWDPAGIRAQARSDGAAHRLHGAKTHVVDGHTARLIIVAAREPGSSGADAIGLFVIDAGAEGLTRELLPTFDQTRKLARLEFDATPAVRLGDARWPAVQRTLRLASVCLAAEQVGGAAACLDMAVDYAKLRTQFGRPIGSFQAVKHRCADLLLAVETARSAAYHAIAVAAEDLAGETGSPDELAMAASLALSHCSEVFARAAGDNVQIHGGVGFTWEHDAHLYLKRAKSSEQLLGGPSGHREVVASLMGL